MDRAGLKAATLSALIIGASILPVKPAAAWGAEGHAIIAIVADQFLLERNSALEARVRSLLMTDTDPLLQGDNSFGNEATWADKFRGTPAGRLATADWHFVDIDVDHPDLNAACFSQPPLQPGLPASRGLAKDCVVDKIIEFTPELQTPGPEQLMALRYLLHFVGDIHQPLHDADHVNQGVRDKGGNCVGILHGNAHTPVRLHSYWDDDLVRSALPGGIIRAAKTIHDGVNPAAYNAMAQGTPVQWAQEGYDLAKTVAYNEVLNAQPVATIQFTDQHGKPDTQCGISQVFQLDAAYDDKAREIVRQQIAKAAIRLTWIIENNFR